MNVQFVETMRGTVVEPNGQQHPIEFTVNASRLGRGRFALKGVAKAAPFLPEGEVTGTLTMALLPPAIAYHLELGNGVRLDAQKDPRPWRPLHSFTFMPVTIKDKDGVVLAEGSMRFDVRELPKFAASWLIDTRQRKELEAERRRLARTQLERG